MAAVMGTVVTAVVVLGGRRNAELLKLLGWCIWLWHAYLLVAHY